MAVQKLQTAGDHAGALAALATAATVPRAEKDDALIMAKLKLFSAQNLTANCWPGKLKLGKSHGKLKP